VLDSRNTVQSGSGVDRLTLLSRSNTDSSEIFSRNWPVAVILNLANCLLQERQGETAMVDFKTAIRTTLLIVDDDVQQLEMRTLVLKMSGFTVLTATAPVEAISIMAQHPHPQNRHCDPGLQHAGNERLCARRLPANALPRPENHPALRCS